jgi:hypothetical protein
MGEPRRYPHNYPNPGAEASARRPAGPDCRYLDRGRLCGGCAAVWEQVLRSPPPSLDRSVGQGRADALFKVWGCRWSTVA